MGGRGVLRHMDMYVQEVTMLRPSWGQREDWGGGTIMLFAVCGTTEPSVRAPLEFYSSTVQVHWLVLLPSVIWDQLQGQVWQIFDVL